MLIQEQCWDSRQAVPICEEEKTELIKFVFSTVSYDFFLKSCKLQFDLVVLTLDTLSLHMFTTDKLVFKQYVA